MQLLLPGSEHWGVSATKHISSLTGILFRQDYVDTSQARTDIEFSPLIFLLLHYIGNESVIVSAHYAAFSILRK
jgi:hypothetical protein